MIRCLRPEPWTRLKSTPNSRANLRIEGLACARKKSFCSTGITTGGGRRTRSAGLDSELTDSALTIAASPVCCGAVTEVVDVEEDDCGDVFSVVSADISAVSCADSSTFKVRIRSFCETLSPAFIFKSFTVPANGEGTSIEALSLSIVINGSSTATVSPDLTSTSITSTASNSPMSGTSTSLILLMRFLLRTTMDYFFRSQFRIFLWQPLPFWLKYRLLPQAHLKPLL